MTPLATLLFAAFAQDLKMPPVFGDRMVLQRDVPVPVWGTAPAGDPITVTFDGQRKTATAEKDGAWKVALDACKAGGPHEIKIAGRGTEIVFKDVLVGEVWVASGQSNMEWPLRGSAGAKEEIPKASNPSLRLFTAPKGPWKECSPDSAAGFSAVAYYFGKELHKTLNVPIGLLHGSRGGMPAQCFMGRKALERDPEFLKVPPDAAHEAACPSCLYDRLIAPLVPYGIRGAIWYQGEANRWHPEPYRRIFPALIRNWRDEWGQGDFPFLYVQLPNTKCPRGMPGEKWAEVREGQFLTLSTPHTAMAVTIDIGDGSIHPANKLDVGRRLALAARAAAYGEKIVASGPLYDSMKVDGEGIRLTFRHTGAGLVSKGEKLKGFTVAGEDRVFAEAEARIEGDAVVARSSKVPRPVAVRYGWTDNPSCTLFNKEGLPASPFRTDTWPRP